LERSVRVVASDKPVALWSVPRSTSTAFERVFVERDDFEVLHKLFSAAYYYSEDRLSDRYSDVEPEAENNYEIILASVLAPRERRVFFKDMAYHAKGLLGSKFVANFANTFIIRDPKYVIASLYKMWPDFTLEETGFEQIYNLFRYATEVNGEDIVVVDAMTFSENPTGVLSAYCDHLGVTFDPGSLSWESREVRRWDNWDGWREAAQQSSGIKRAERKDPPLSEKAQEAYEYCLPSYYELAAHAIHGTARPTARNAGQAPSGRG
jgi:sulfotransferase family protein